MLEDKEHTSSVNVSVLSVGATGGYRVLNCVAVIAKSAGFPSNVF